MQILIRQENENDYKETENLTREAFWDVYKPGCDEHLIVNRLRSINGFVKELDFVACVNDQMVGNIMFSKAFVINEVKEKFEVLNLGPVSVLPSMQKQGIGKLLINHSIAMARDLKYIGIFLYGNPKYYSKYGFSNTRTYNIKTASDKYVDAFMCLELFHGSLNDVNGKYIYDTVFETTKEEVEEFEKGFPPKQKHKLSTQIFG